MTSKDPSAILQTCFQCGTCNASCPVRIVLDDFNPVRISRMILLGFKEEVLKSKAIWLCASCHACADRCPRGVSFIDVIRELQNEAAKKGYAPEQLKAVADAVVEQGWTLNFDDFEFLRLDLNLPAPPEADTEVVKKMAKRLKLWR